MLASFITEPVGGSILGLESAQGGTGGKQTYFWVLFPSLLASAVCLPRVPAQVGIGIVA